MKTNFNKVDHVHSQKIADALVSPHYIKDFQEWMKDKGIMNEDSQVLAEKLMLNILNQAHGIDVACVFKDGSGCQSHQPQVEQLPPPEFLMIESAPLLFVKPEIF